MRPFDATHEAAYDDGYRQALEDVARDLDAGSQPGWAKRYRGWAAMIRTGIASPAKERS